MHPSKLRNLLPSFAMEMERPVDEVEAVTNFFYKTLRAKLSELNNTMVHAHNLGTFYIKENALDNSIQATQNILDKLTNTDITEYGMKKKLLHQQETMSNIKQKLTDEKQRRRSIIDKRFNNESGEKRDKNMEE